MKPLELERLIETFDNVANKILNSSTYKTKNNIVILKQNFNWDKKNGILLHNNIQINLSKNEIILMNILIKNNQKISSNDELIDNIFHGAYDKTAENLKPIISRFRKKTQQTVENIYGLGYRMVFQYAL
jgi:DNA-binding response OmpR family regulator